MFRNILQWPHKKLRKTTKPVKVFDEKLNKIIGDLIDTLKVEGGTGLAANQIGYNKKVFVINPGSFGHKNLDPFPGEEEYTVFINPQLILTGDDTMWDEACLSVRGYSGKVPRKTAAVIKYNNIKGEKKEISCDWPMAGVLQHEYDHLLGIVYIDRMKPLASRRLRNKIQKAKKLQARIQKRKLREVEKDLRSIRS